MNQTMSKFGRLNFETDAGLGIRTVSNVLDSLADANMNKTKKRSVVKDIEIGQRLMSPEYRSRNRFRSTVKVEKKVPKVRKYVKPVNNTPELPGAAQYTPNYEATLPKAPNVTISTEKQRVISASDRTQSELLHYWQRDMRFIDFTEDKKTTISPEYEKLGPKPFVKHSKGIVSAPVARDSFLPKDTNPSPASYHISRQLDKPRNIAFQNQQTRPEIPTLPDHTFYNLARSIDATKPRQGIGIVSFDRQTAREKETDQKMSVWDEIEAEQRALLGILQDDDNIPKPTRKRPEPFAQQTTNFGRNPFAHLMKTEAPSDASYDIQTIDRRIPPRGNFGRALDDNDRTIYARSEAPDVLYGGVAEEWANAHPRQSMPPLFDNMHDRKSPYDYMPTTCGSGTYVMPELKNWSFRTPCVMAKMGERKYTIEVPPQYAKRPASQSVLAVFQSRK